MTEREPRHRDDDYDEPDFDEGREEGDDLDFDFTPSDRLKSEVLQQSFRFRYEGDVFEIPHKSKWSTRTALALDSGDLAAWALGVLGDEETAQNFLDIPTGDMDTILEKGLPKVGVELKNRGERRRSSRTSRSTQKRSNRR
ncbi:hypothetical protein SCYAM73S_02505 [Streptomyces cyaneofuscatus]|uniref:hypothetical protein n=1 Tax=Streptomyces cyaneofuscatus TaxID=66883 RepID=UPI0004C88B5E|nr:hypothetical protein [Streptomyces cyaneofuscatus]